MKKKLFKSWHDVVAAVVIAAAVIAMVVGIVSTIVEIKDVSVTTPEEVYEEVLEALEDSAVWNDREFPITYISENEYRDTIYISKESVTAVRAYGVDGLGYYQSFYLVYYVDGKIYEDNQEANTKTVTLGEYERSAQHLREDRMRLLEKVQELLLSGVARTFELDEYVFEHTLHSRTLTVVFDRQQMDDMGYTDVGEEVKFTRHYSPCWQVGIKDLNSGNVIYIPLPHEGKYSGDKMFPEIPDSFQGYTVIE